LQRAQHLKREWEGKGTVRRRTLDDQLQRAGLLIRDGRLQMGLPVAQRRAHQSQAGQLIGDRVVEGFQGLPDRRQLLVQALGARAHDTSTNPRALPSRS